MVPTGFVHFNVSKVLGIEYFIGGFINFFEEFEDGRLKNRGSVNSSLK